MLVLTRTPGQSIIINDDISITVLSLTPHQVKLGIKAPKDIAVHRDEIYQKIQREKKESV